MKNRYIILIIALAILYAVTMTIFAGWNWNFTRSYERPIAVEVSGASLFNGCILHIKNVGCDLHDATFTLRMLDVEYPQYYGNLHRGNTATITIVTEELFTLPATLIVDCNEGHYETPLLSTS